MADFVIVRKGGPSFEGGSPTPPGNISSFGTVSYAHKDGKTEIRFNPAEPSPLGTYKGIAIYVEDPDQSGVDLLVADGSTAWDGTAVAAGEAKPILAGRHEYKALEPDAPAIAKIPYRNATRTVRIKALSFSTQVTNAYASSPSTTLEITPDGPAKPDSATAWTEMATGISAPTMYTGDEDGKLKRYLIFDGIAVPSDTRFAGWSIWSHGWPNDAEFYRMCPDQTGTSVIVEMDEPTSSLTLTFYLRSSGFDAEGKPHLNPIVAGITPSVAVAVGTTSGVLDISKAFGFNAAEFEVTIDGYSVKAVDFTKGLNSITLDGSEVPKIVIAPDGVALGWIGKDAGSGYAGAWFKRVLVGGTAPANAPFFADASGNVVANGIYVNSAGTPLGWIGANGGLTGAWFKKLYVGGAAPASAKIVADDSGNVSISDATFTITSGTTTVAINSTDKIKVSDSSVGFESVITGATLSSRSSADATNNTELGANAVVGHLSNKRTFYLENTATPKIRLYDGTAGENACAELNTDGLYLYTGKVVKVGGNQVVGARQGAITAPAGGGTVDTEARSAIGSILTALRTHGLISS